MRYRIEGEDPSVVHEDDRSFYQWANDMLDEHGSIQRWITLPRRRGDTDDTHLVSFADGCTVIYTATDAYGIQ